VRALGGDARQAVFSPLDDGSGRGAAVVRRLGAAIALGIVEDGEQLPSEASLSASLNVATVTLRDALGELRSRGLLETRRGRGGGTFVRADEGALAELARARLGQIDTVELRELGDLRVALAGTAARLAAQRAGAPDIARLRELLDLFAAAERPTQQLRAEGRYLIAVAAAAQSVRLTQHEIELQTELGQVSFGLRPTRDEVRAAVRAHRKVVSAIESRDGDRARALAERQVEVVTRGLIDRHLRLTRQGGGRSA
jgi:DNA-binding FadR family transcriptional regulator